MKNFYKFIKYFLAVFVIFFSVNLQGFAQIFNFEKNPNLSTVTFPAGTLFRGRIQNELNSGKVVIGDMVYFVIPFNVKMGKVTCIPKDALVTGRVVQVQKAKPGRNGLLQIKFDEIQFPDGWKTEFSAHIWTRDNQGIIGGELTKKTSLRKVPHYIEGIGTVASTVQVGQRAPGKEKKLPAGTECVIVLDKDLHVKYLEKL